VRAAAQAGGITDPTELAQFMAQVSHESGGFKYLTELGKDSYFQKYEGRKDLGNVQPGDGVKYKGRGYIQLTGRANYAKYGKIIGVDLENNPELAATPENGAKLAVAYWNDRVKKRVKDFKDTAAVTKIINGGANGLQSRVALFEKYQKTAGEATTQVASNQAGAPGAGDSGKGATSVASNQQTGGQLAQKSMDVETTSKTAKDTLQQTADVSMDAGPGSRKLHEKAPVASQDDFGKLISSHFNVAT
jgi:putative chitinase